MRYDGETGALIDHFVDEYAAYSWGIAFSPNPIPDPATIWLLSSGLIALAGIMKKIKR